MQYFKVKWHIKSHWKNDTSGQAIVKNSDENEENIEAGEDNEEKVERVPHLFGWEDDDDEDVTENTNTTHAGLEKGKKNSQLGSVQVSSIM